MTATRPANLDHAPEPDRSLVSILLVDDDANNLLALESILDTPEYRLVRAQTADAALLALMNEDYAAIVLDVQMPDVNGIELARLIKRRRKTQHIPILFLTAHYRESEDAVLGYDVGAVDYLTKPVHPAVLRSKIGVFVDLFRKTRALAAMNRHMEAEIADRKTAEERFRVVVEAAPTALIVVDEDDRIVLVNPQAERLFGKEGSELVGASLNEFIARDSWADDETREIVVKSEHGDPVSAELSVTPIHSTEGTRRLVSFVDLTERKRAEAAWRTAHLELEAKNIALERQAEAEAANAAKDRFLAMLSHELRTPLSPVLHAVTLLDEDVNSSPELRETLQVIRRNVQLEARLIDDLLDLARIRNGKLQLQRVATDAHELVRHAAEICEPDIAARELTVKFDFGAAHAILEADPARLQQVLWNLISNAVKFTGPSGSLFITTANDESGEWLEIAFRDTGVGIDAQALPRIFDAFEQASPQASAGLGLGLAICKALTEYHGGRIRAESAGLGRGTTFTVTLPTAARSVRLPSRDAVPPPQPGARLRLLVVEDHADTAMLLLRLLVRRGYEVHAAANVAEALEVAGRVEFDVLVTDIGLPDGNGVALFEQLKRRPGGADLRGIALSGFGTEMDIERSKAAGFSDHLTKPVDITSLQQSLRQIGEELRLAAK